MGMAASQARYLALVARKSNCEYEGQQINQARTALSNQSANLFNQMLGLTVPVPPSTQDYTRTQYSFKDGVNASTISNWEQLSTADPDYNYVVTHYYYTDQYTGSQKMLNDPQVQFKDNTATATEIANLRATIAAAELELEAAKEAKDSAQADYEDALKALNSKRTEAADLANHATLTEGITGVTYNNENNVYTVTTTEKSSTYTDFENLTEPAKTSAINTINALIEIGALPSSYATDKTGLFFSASGKSFAYETDLTSLVASVGDGELSTYSSANAGNYSKEISRLQGIVDLTQGTAKTAEERYEAAQEAYDNSIQAYEELNHPEYIGNCKLTALGSLTSDQEAEIRQIITDMQKEGITSDITKYYNPETGEYTGGLYSFKMNGVTYFTTYTDLEASYKSGSGINNIDGQNKLAYYNATYVSTKVEKTEKALVETDGLGRFTSIRFEDNSLTYTLTMETVTDDVAYEDAMNQYLYENAKYDKMVQDINAKTSIIQQEDQELELRLKQLDTEQKALSTEMEAVKKVVNDNIENSFKTFNG